MASEAFISRMYQFKARFWPHFNFVDFRSFFGQEYMGPVLIWGIFCSDGPFQRSLLYKLSRVRWQMRDSENWATDGVSVAIWPWLLSIAQS